jgi:hypothetical protein
MLRPWVSLWLLAALASLALPGCGGCRDDAAEKEKEKEAALKREKPKPDFETLKFATRPTGPVALTAIKPGHWTGAALDLRANNFDFRGQLVLQLIDPMAGGALELDPKSPFLLETSRPAVLPKGQRRFLECELFCPRDHTGNTMAVARLLAARSGVDSFGDRFALELMPAHQYHLVVLARSPDRYEFVNYLDTVRPPGGDVFSTNHNWHYRVERPAPKERLPLAGNVLGWTSIACVIWDDRDPGDLNPQQQQALVDWIHWGGQLLISGPQTLDTLRGSFLEPYLPVSESEVRQLEQADVDTLNSLRWKKELPRLKVVRPWTGLKLVATVGATCPPAYRNGSDPLLLERRVGRGRVLVSAFGLSQGDLVNWPGYDEFFHACLLRRKARDFTLGEFRWADGARPWDSERVSEMRFWSRDTKVDANEAFVQTDEPPIGPGVAAWNDRSKVAETARDTLIEAAGIVVPQARFVLAVLGVYLLVLVPVNWLLFRLIGRVEWAWAAVPPIAVAGTVLVVWLAQLDIGFARARSEVNVLELHAGYPRAHLTRYTALYTSLGTRYSLRFDDPTAVALPFSSTSATLSGQARYTVDLHRGRKTAGETDDDAPGTVALEGFEVSSNTTGLIHSEQMVDLGGSIEAQPAGANLRVANHTRLRLQGALLTAGNRAGWIGTLEPGESRDIVLESEPAEAVWARRRGSSLMTAEKPPTVGVHLHTLFKTAIQRDPNENLRLIAWTDEEPGGMVIEPAVAQSRIGNLVVAHLDYRPFPQPEADWNVHRPSPVQATEPDESKE